MHEQWFSDPDTHQHVYWEEKTERKMKSVLYSFSVESRVQNLSHGTNLP